MPFEAKFLRNNFGKFSSYLTENTASSLYDSLEKIFSVNSKKHQKARILWGVDKFLAEIPNAVHNCSRYGVAAARFASEPPGSVTRLSKTFTLLGVH